MWERDQYLHGVPCWVDIAWPDPEAATRFYGGLFGWEFADVSPADSPDRYYMARLRGLDVAAIGSASAGGASRWNTYVRVDDVDAAAARVRDAGGTVVAEPFEFADAGRAAVLADPSGAGFRVWQPNRHVGAELVNAPDTWNFSDLNTRDVEAATTFYGRVFGWDAVTVDFGAGATVMLCVPGYGDFLAERDPSLRSKHAEDGVPERFSDAVGWANEMTDHDFAADAAPHWGITFSVADADVTVAKAVELGGALVTPAYDLGPSRLAVLRDPHGAEFTVNSYQPE